ncbi:MAG: hypothetical protein WC222_07155 [Parachlamydiales bacterium]|jgi:hypothetical protein
MTLSLEGVKAAFGTVGSGIVSYGSYVGNGIYNGTSALASGVVTGSKAVAEGVVAGSKVVGTKIVYVAGEAKTFAGHSYAYLSPKVAAAATWATGPGAGFTFLLSAVLAFAITEFKSLQPTVNPANGRVTDPNCYARWTFKAIALGCAVSAGVVFAIGPQAASALALSKVASGVAFLKTVPYVGALLV